ncbi:MAG: hypothetical protein ACR2L9_02620, partial [Solirubrobacteraceae bacterium]
AHGPLPVLDVGLPLLAGYALKEPLHGFTARWATMQKRASAGTGSTRDHAFTRRRSPLSWLVRREFLWRVHRGTRATAAAP